MRRMPLFGLNIFLLASVLGQCVQRTQGPQTWLDRPLDGSTAPLEALTIQAHASDADGVASIEFAVDGVVLSSAGAGGGRLGEAAIEWSPPGPGVYTVQARAVDGAGNAGADAVSVVTVGGEALEPPPTTTPTPTPEFILAETSTTAAEPVQPPAVPATATTVAQPVQPPANLPSPTTVVAQPVQPIPPTVTPTFTNTPVPPAQVRFTADTTSLIAGQCTDLRWEVENATAVFLDGQGVVGHDSRQVCPAETTTYILYVQAPAGDVQRSLTINVTPITVTPSVTPSATWTPVPVDATPPTISSVDVSPDEIVTGAPGCANYSRTTNVAAGVSDDGELGSVVANWSVGGESGQVWLAYMFGSFMGSIGPVNTPGTLTVYVVAEDAAGNNAQAGPFFVTVNNCVG